MAKRLTAVFCFLWCLFLVHFVFAQWNRGDEGTEVVSVFSGIGLEETGVCLEITGELGRLATERKALDRLKEAAAALGLSETVSIEEVKKSNGTIWLAEGESELSGLNSRYQTMVKLIAVEEGFFVRYYLQAAVTGAADADQIAVIRTRLEQIRERENLECLIGMRLEGSWNRVLSETEKQEVGAFFLAATGAKLTETVSDGNLLMLYAYGEDLGDAVIFNQKKMNLNLIIRDGASRTRCFAGIPAVWSDDVMAAE